MHYNKKHLLRNVSYLTGRGGDTPMPPKVRFTREEIIRAALDITRESGPEALTARSLAARLDCSAKPIFGQIKFNFLANTKR